MALLTWQAPASVTVQGWWHLDTTPGTAPSVLLDATTNGRHFQHSQIVPVVYQPPIIGPGAGALPSSEAAGGALGAGGYTSTRSLRFGLEGDSDTFWETGYLPPATNYGIEVWIKPQNRGGFWRDAGNQVWIFSSGGFSCPPCTGSSGGACVRVQNLGDSGVISAGIIVGQNSVLVADFGPQIPVDTNNWMHLALINTNGIVSFYTNGVLCAVNEAGNETAPAGVMHLGTDGAWNAFDGFMDELRVFTFTNAADFSPSDLLYTVSPRIIQPPQDISVWNNGAATLPVLVSLDACTGYQWRLYGTNAPGGAGADTASLYLNSVTSADSGKWYDCLVTNTCTSNTVTTTKATLTVVPVNPDNVNAYRGTITAEPGLAAYYPADTDTGSTLTDTKGGRNGSFEGAARYDGQTTRSFGARAVFIRQGDGRVQLPSNSVFEFGSGNGTVEAIIYLMSPVVPEPGTMATLFSAASADGSQIRYQLGVSVDGGTLVCTNDAGVKLTWAVPVNLLNRLAHVAFVFSGTTSVTAYVDGQSLGTLSQTGFGSGSVPCWIGYGPALGAIMDSSVPSYWYGTIDELAVYSTALTATQIAIHNSKFLYGTNTSAPSIVRQPGSRTLYAGGSPTLTVTVAGTPPLSYQWKSGSSPIAGATTSALTLLNTTTNSSGAYTLFVTNMYGWTSTVPVNLTFISPPSGYAATVFADHPAAFWRLAESSGPTAADSAGLNDGTYSSSGVTFGVAGPVGAAGSSGVRFDGAAGRVVVPYSAALNPGGPFSIEFWAQPSAYGFYSPVSSMVRPGLGGGYEFYMAGNYGGYEFHTGANGTYNMATGDSSAPPSGVWAHVVGVWDGTTMSLYVNGYPASPDPTDSVPPLTPNTSLPLCIGSRSDGVRFFNGAMSDVAFYNYALTPEQVLNHVQVGGPVQMAIRPSTRVIADTKPAGEPYDALNVGATWLASDAGRSGVLQFNATNNNQILLFGYPDLALTNGTIMFWMRSAGVVHSGADGGEAALLFDWRPAGKAYVGIVIAQQDDCDWCNHGSIMVQGGYGHPSANSGSVSVSDNNWHHVALTYNTSGEASPSIILYIDGAAVASGSAGADWAWPDQNTVIQLGSETRYDSWWNSFNGQMDEVRIYSRILSAAEVGTAMSGGLVNSDLKLRYSFDTAPTGYEVTWPYGNMLSADQLSGSWAWPGGLTNTPPFPAISPFPVSKPTVERRGMQYFRGER